MPGLRRADPGPDVIPNPLPSFVRLDARKDVKTGFEPWRETVRNLKGLVKRVLRRKDSVYSVFFPLNCIIAMELDHGPPRRNGLRSIDLNFVIVLRTGGLTRKNKQSAVKRFAAM